MTDISLVWAPGAVAPDFVQQGALLEADSDLATALWISLFSDRTARADDVIPDGGTDRRGWWGDFASTVPLGSRLWLLERSKLTPAVAGAAQRYIREALQWLIDDGVAASLEVTTEIQNPATLAAQVVVRRRNGSTLAVAFPSVWANV